MSCCSGHWKTKAGYVGMSDLSVIGTSSARTGCVIKTADVSQVEEKEHAVDATSGVMIFSHDSEYFADCIPFIEYTMCEKASVVSLLSMGEWSQEFFAHLVKKTDGMCVHESVCVGEEAMTCKVMANTHESESSEHDSFCTCTCAWRSKGIHTCLSVYETGQVSESGVYSMLSCCICSGGPMSEKVPEPEEPSKKPEESEIKQIPPCTENNSPRPQDAKRAPPYYETTITWA